MKKRVAIIIPVCNEKGNIQAITESLQQTMLELPYEYSILFIDDGSSDETLQTIKKWQIATVLFFLFHFPEISAIRMH